MTHNKRFPKMWEIITNKIDFRNKVLVDVGCGGGDLVLAAAKAGAKRVYAVDHNHQILSNLYHKILGLNNIILLQDDINGWGTDWVPTFRKTSNDKVDILSCFSVLPYTENPNELLRKFSGMAKIVLIECQYFGDGPGFDWLMNNNDMEYWLQDIWGSVERIGQTYIPDRKKNRTIWMCK